VSLLERSVLKGTDSPFHLALISEIMQAFCTYHLPDGHEALGELISEASPRYILGKKAMKLPA
jgi:hypothetical protein